MDFSHRLTILVPTRDRPDALRRLLSSIKAQTARPDRVIVSASGSMVSREVAEEYSELGIQYIHLDQGGTSWQRNAALRALNPECTLVGFFDDDVVLDPDALEKILTFWETAPAEVGAAGFNFRNLLAPETSRKWSLGPVRRLYKMLATDGRKGRVLQSGFPTPIFPVTENTYVDWLETLGLTLRREVVEEFRFDDFFAGYSYLEHVEYTYRVSRKYKLCAVSNALVTHHSGPIRNSYLLGKMQVINRVHLVSKHRDLSLPRCYFALGLHTLFNVAVGVMLRDRGYFQRARGNLAGFTQAAMGRLDPVTGGVK